MQIADSVLNGVKTNAQQSAPKNPIAQQNAFENPIAQQNPIFQVKN